jgi:nitrogen fixation/metabolism regulation signal transduction histidine kinase
MGKRYRDLSIQNKLFGAFAITILVATLSIVTSLLSLLVVQNLSAELIGISQEAQRAYQAQANLQELERAEKSFVLTGNLEDANNFLIHLALFKEYYRRALLEADDPRIKNALFEIERAMKAYVEAFEQITKTELAPEGGPPDQSQVDDLTDMTTLEMANMNDQIFLISQQGWQALGRAAERQGAAMGLAALVNILSLVVFLALAIFTALVISRGIFAPAALLSQAARAAGDGRFSPGILVPITQVPDEVGKLAKAFIEMDAAVQAQEAALREEIEQVREILDL